MSQLFVVDVSSFLLPFQYYYKKNVIFQQPQILKVYKYIALLMQFRIFFIL